MSNLVTTVRLQCFAVSYGRLLPLFNQRHFWSQTIFASANSWWSCSATNRVRALGPTFLDFCVSLVQRLANLSPRCKAGNDAALAPPGLAHVLAPAFTPRRAARPPPECGGTSDPYRPN